MSMLEKIRGPRDLDDLTERELVALAREIRDVLIETVSRTGGHLGPNLGMVEITLALHRVFDSPHDRILFDVGHQAYVHKLLTGRHDRFSELRQEGGLSGYPSRAESEHDLIENSHASAALSYADGLAKAYELRGEKRHIVTVIGDGALTGGMAWEALNNIAAAKNRPMVIVVNDNGRSYTRTVGGFAEHLNALRTNPKYERVLELVRASLTRTPLVGNPLFEVLHGLKRGLKDILAPQGLFEDLGMKYVGPVDGHDRGAVEHALEAAKRFDGPVIVHCVTRKGFGYEVAERDEQDHLHQIRTDQTGTWTAAFSEELVALGAERSDIVAITAAMKDPTGLGAFAAAYPSRFFDVGIAEQHAVTSAAGLALGGMHPVVAIYATFMNRAFDQLLMDVALHQCGVTFVLDRSGITGDDGASHNGMWDLSIFQVVPGLRIAAPRDSVQLRSLLREAVEVSDAPTMLRWSKGKAQAEISSIDRVGGCDVLVRSGESDVLLVAVGSMVPTCVEVATRLEGQGIGATVVDPRWIKPVDAELVELARKYRLVVTVEDNGRTGGAGAALGVAMSDEGVDTPLHVVGIPQEFLSHAKRPALIARLGLGAQDLARDIVERIALLDDELLDPAPELEVAPLQSDPHP